MTAFCPTETDPLKVAEPSTVTVPVTSSVGRVLVMMQVPVTLNVPDTKTDPEAVPVQVPVTGSETPLKGTVTVADPESDPVRLKFPVEVREPPVMVTSSQALTTSSWIGFSLVPMSPVTET